MLCAYASRVVSGPTPKRYSIIFRIDSNPKIPWCTYPRLTHGETATAGIRNPIWPKSLLMSRFIRMSGTRGGRTWSKKPPHSSYTMNSAPRFHCGDSMNACTTSDM